MSEPNESSDFETSDRDDKDADFDVDDYRREVESDDSSNELPKDNVTMEENNAQHIVYSGPIISGHRFDKKLVCVKYPGNVMNVDKAIETLGGISSISTAVDAPNRRLELRFRPDDGYSKPTCGDRHGTTGFLLRVRIKKNRVNQAKGDTTVNIIKSQSADAANSRTFSIIQGEIDSNMSQFLRGEQIDNLMSDIAVRNNHQGDAVNNLVNQARNQDIGFSVDSSSEAAVRTCASNLYNLDTNPPKRKKDASPTFDHDKYENLSQDAGYDLPRLKILGRVDIEFNFTNLCDFQYVPMTQDRSDPNKLECIYSSIYPTGIPSFSWLKNDVPYFLPPAAFSRMDTIQQYVPKSETDSGTKNIIGKSKKSQAGFPNYIYFSTPEVPDVAPKGIETAMKVKFLQNSHLEKVRQLFEERPIWSKNAIMHKTQFTSEQLKILLPSVAYYFMTGPWRIMWVKLGYDPRKDINARKYQTLDYRLKAMHGLGSTVRCKRNYSTYTLPYKSAPVSKQKPAILTATLSQEQNPKKERHLHENVYIYREGMVPPSRQMFYQYCDIAVGEIQQMLAKLPDPLPGIRCHEKRGWLPTGFDVQCREIINKQIQHRFHGNESMVLILG
ncbi:general transcription factor 3C polypeptide 5 isoform X2 [Odontomachus brunneus]|uniref:general transcription factor 3C polypeptide 5 isoform X2 n=1 Tax=Odontomachus brunneus TaxID=486640 RepID=UPI0013F2B034|nr:general transcription factor 3C polypeptide 5 isoform X2 [Odontomachus brunneus]